jgi:ActR/RegA family two-component response regulator
VTDAPARILVLDDHPDTAEGLGRLFRLYGLEAVAARKVADARRIALERPPTACVCDLRLPDGSGLVFVRWLTETCPGCRVVIATGFPDDLTPELAREAGAIAVLDKPLHAATVLGALGIAGTPPAIIVERPPETGP